MAAGKSIGKAVYAFSPDLDSGKVTHVNFLPKEVLDRKVLDAKVWLGEVSKVIGGKVCVACYSNTLSHTVLTSGIGRREGRQRDGCR